MNTQCLTYINGLFGTDGGVFKGNVIQYGAGEEEYILEHYTNMFTQGIDIIVFQLCAINIDMPVFDRV
ncbi:hypothetical protein D9M68_774370 [compost metagenome]